MNERLREVDANLLLSLHALLEERNLTHAGERMTMSQPAMSGALARLRKHFDDELLVRVGRGFELTPLAEEIRPMVAEAVEAAEALLGNQRRVRRRQQQQAVRGEHVRVRHDGAGRAAHPAARRAGAGLHGRAGPDRRPPRPVRGPADAPRPDHRAARLRVPGPAAARLHRRAGLPGGRDHPSSKDGALTLDDLQAMPHAVAQFAAAGERRRPLEVELDAKGVEDRTVLVQVTSLLTLPFAVGRHRHVRVRAVPAGASAASTCSGWPSPRPRSTR